MTDTSGTTGQASGNQQGGAQGQEPGASGGQGQESGANQPDQQGQQHDQQGQQGTPDLTAITDPNLRAWVEQQARQASEARQEAARYRTERNQYQTQVQEFQRSQETAEQAAQREAQERQARLDELERENRDLRVNVAVENAATAAKAHNPATVVRMLASQVELDESGKPKNLDDLLKDLRQSDPYLFKRTNQNGGDGNDGGGAPAGGMNDVIRGALAARRGRG